jgi:hypothetical protein
VSHAVPIMDHLTCTQEKAKYRIQSVSRYDNSRLGRNRQTKPSSSINVQNGTMIFMRPVKLYMPIWPTGGETPRVSRRQRSVCTWTRGRRVHQAHRVASSWQSLTDTLAHENHTRAPGQPLHVSKAPQAHSEINRSAIQRLLTESIFCFLHARAHQQSPRTKTEHKSAHRNAISNCMRPRSVR